MKKAYGEPTITPASAALTNAYFQVHANGNNIIKLDELYSELDNNVNNEEDKAIYTTYAEYEIDVMRQQKDIALNMYVEEAKLKEQLQMKLNSNNNGVGGGAAPEKEEKPTSNTNKSRK